MTMRLAVNTFRSLICVIIKTSETKQVALTFLTLLNSPHAPFPTMILSSYTERVVSVIYHSISHWLVLYEAA